MIDIKIIETKEKLYNVINESGLPISVLSLILHEVSNATDSTLQNLIINYKKSQMKGENNNGMGGFTENNRNGDSSGCNSTEQPGEQSESKNNDTSCSDNT